MSEAQVNFIYKVTENAVYGFFKEHRFLSNFHPCEVKFEGLKYGSTEAAYQAAKTTDLRLRESLFTDIAPNKAKFAGRKIKLRADWEKVKLHVMYAVCSYKFACNEELKQKLLATGDKYLEETNWWNDRFWGADSNHRGENNLGKVLMSIRKALKNA